MILYMDQIKEIQVAKVQQRVPYLLTEDCKRAEYQSPAGFLFFLGQSMMLQAWLLESMMQQKISQLLVTNLLNANKMVWDNLLLKPIIHFQNSKQNEGVKIVWLSIDSNADLGDACGQKGSDTGLRIFFRLND